MMYLKDILLISFFWLCALGLGIYLNEENKNFFSKNIVEKKRADINVIQFVSKVDKQFNEEKLGQFFSLKPIKTLNKKDKKTILIIGDSHASALSGLAELLTEKENAIVTIGYMGLCPFLSRSTQTFPSIKNKIKRNDMIRLCLKRNKKVLEHIKNGEFEHVMISARWNIYVDPKLWTVKDVDRPITKILSPFCQKTISFDCLNILVQKTVEDILLISNKRVRVTVFGQAPIFENKNVKSLHEKNVLGSELVYFGKLRDLNKQNNRLNNMLNVSTNKFGHHVSFINLIKLFCLQKSCSPIFNGLLRYSDSNHLNKSGGQLVFKYFFNL